MTKRGRWTRLRTVGVVVLLLGVLLGSVEALSAVGTRFALGRFARAFTGVEATTVEATSIRGSRLTSLRITDFRLTVGEFGEAATIESLELQYRFLPLLRRSLIVDRVLISGVRVDLRECRTAWYRDRDPPPPDSGAAWSVSLAELSVVGGAAAGGECVDTATWSVGALNASIREVQTSPNFVGRLDDLRMEIEPSGTPTGYAAHLSVAGTFHAGVLEIDSLGLSSPRSQVTAAGVLRALTAAPGTPNIDFDVHADPLAFADLEPFAPSLVADGSARVDANLRSSSDVLRVTGLVEILAGGRIEMDATLAETDRDFLSYDGTVSMDAVDPSTILDQAAPGHMEGVVDFDLEGQTLEELSGTLTIAGRNASSASDAGLELRLDATLAQGLADIDGRIAVDRGAGTVAGTVRPFGQEREVELRGEFDYSTPDDLSTSAVVAGDYDVALSFEDWRTASGRAELTLGPSSLGNESIPEASVVLELEAGVGSWRTVARAGLGRLDARGTLHLTDERLDIEHAEVRDLDVASLGGAQPGSTVNGILTATRTKGVSPLGDWTGRAVLGRTSMGSLVSESGAIDVSLVGTRVVVDVDTKVLAGSARARIEGDIGDDMRLDLTRSVFNGIDLSAASGVGAGSSALSGTARGSWSARGARPSRLLIALGDSRVSRMQIDTGTVNVTVSGDSAVVGGSLLPTSAQIIFQGVRSGSGDSTKWRLDEGRFANFDIAALAEGGDAPARLTGRLTGRWQGQEVSRLTGEARLELDRSEIGPWQVETATVDATMADGRSILFGSVEADGLSGEVEASVDLPVEGASSRGTARFQGMVEGILIDSAYAEATYDSASLRVDTLQVWSAAVVAGGRASLLREPTRVQDFSLEATVDHAEPLQAWFALRVDTLARADVVATGVSVGDSLEVAGRLDGVGLSFGTVHVGTFEATGHTFMGATGVLSYPEARVDAYSVRAGRLPVEHFRLEASPEGDGAVVTVAVVVDEERGLTGSVEAHPAQDGMTVVVHELDVDLLNQDWGLEGTPTLHIAEGVTVQDLTLVSRSQSGRITADGTVGRGGAQSLNVRVDGLALAGLSDVIGYDGLRGVAGGSLGFAGTALAPTIVASVDARGTLRGSDPADLSFDVGYEDQLLSVEGSLELGAGQAARLSGEFPVDVTLAPVDSTETRVTLLTDRAIDVEVTARQLGLQWLAPWVVNENVRDVTGMVDADLRATGTPTDPAPRGAVEARNVTASLPVVGLRLRDGLLRGHFEQSRFLVDEFHVVSGGGRMAGSGSVLIDDGVPGAIDLAVSLDDFLAIRTDVFRAVTDGTLTVRGVPREPIVAGSVDVLSADVFLGGRFAGAPAEVVELTAEDYETLAARFGYRPPAESPLTRTTGAGPLALDVQVRMGRDTWVRQRANPALSVQFTGDLRVEKAPHELEQVFGRLEAVPRGSYVEQFGRRFAITSGSVDFNGLLPDLRLDVSAEYAVPARGDPTASEVVIGLGVVGGVTDLGLVLSSRPEMENSDIVSYLATGRPASQSMQFGSSGSGQLVERGTTMALGLATSAVERLASESVGLDVMQIRSEGSRGVTVVAGRYVSPRLYLGFKQPIGFRRSDSSANTRTRSPEVEIEYQALRWLLLNLQREGSRIDFFLRSRYAY